MQFIQDCSTRRLSDSKEDVAIVTSCIDASVRIVTKSSKVGSLLIFSISLISDHDLCQAWRAGSVYYTFAVSGQSCWMLGFLSSKQLNIYSIFEENCIWPTYYSLILNIWELEVDGVELEVAHNTRLFPAKKETNFLSNHKNCFRKQDSSAWREDRVSRSLWAGKGGYMSNTS